MTSGITVTYTKNFHVALSLQFQLLAGIGNDTTLIILETYSYDANIYTICVDFRTVGSHFNRDIWIEATLYVGFAALARELYWRWPRGQHVLLINIFGNVFPISIGDTCF